MSQLVGVQGQTVLDRVFLAVQDPKKFDEYGSSSYGIISWSDEKARLDNVAAALQQEPDSIVYLSIYAGRRACVGEAQARSIRAKNYLVREHGIQADRVLWKENGYRETLTVEVWIQPRWAVAPYPAPTVNKSEVQIIHCKRSNRGRQSRGKA